MNNVLVQRWCVGTVQMLALLLILNGDALAKRIAPASVPPVTVEQREFRVVHFGQTEQGESRSGGLIEVYQDDRRIAIIDVYSMAYDASLEADIQDVFITGLSQISPTQLKVVNELGQSFRLDVETMQVQRCGTDC